MREIVVVGAGRIGAAIAEMLAGSGAYSVTVADRSAEQLARLDPDPRIGTARIEIGDPKALTSLLYGRFAVLSAAPYHLTIAIAEAAAAAGVHYLDLTEDVKSTRKVKQIAASARTAFVPQCGLAPGFVTIAANGLMAEFETLDEVRLRVGALPRHPDNALNYSLTWSPDGVINEYCEPCEAIVEGELREVAPLEDREEFVLDGVRYEAFNTSGGLGSLCEALRGRVRNLSYRTIRYPGHAAIMKLLLNDLHLAERRDLARAILEHALPGTGEDVVIVHITVKGRRGGRDVEARYSNAIPAGAGGYDGRSAIQLTTAAGICTVLDMLAEGRLPQRGFVRQDAIGLTDFLANRFGRLYGEKKAMPRVA